jgi:hypothetical protein
MGFILGESQEYRPEKPGAGTHPFLLRFPTEPGKLSDRVKELRIVPALAGEERILLLRSSVQGAFEESVDLLPPVPQGLAAHGAMLIRRSEEGFREDLSCLGR